MADNPQFTIKKLCYAVWLKFYAEQVETYKEDMNSMEQQELMRNALHEFINKYGHKYKIDSIVHYKDYNTDDMLAPSIEKPHSHLLCYMESTGTKENKFRLQTLLNDLKKCGIRYREEDKTLLEKSTKFPRMRAQEHCKVIVYHTHETAEAREKDGKEFYSREERITNLTPSELDLIYHIYEQKFNKIDNKDNTLLLEDYCNQAYALGQQGGDFDKWFMENIPPAQLKTVKSTLIDYYEYGVSDFLASPASTLNIRCAIFIAGQASAGKTYNSKQALKSLGYKVLPIEAGGTGKLDELKPSHGAVVVSDTNIKNLLAMADNSFTRVYRRNNSNPLWCGQYLIITYNKDLDGYLADFYSNTITSFEQIQAVKSRFFECTVDPYTNKLQVWTASTRGDSDTLVKRAQMALAFKDAYNKSVENFKRPDMSPERLIQANVPNLFEVPKITLKNLNGDIIN